MSAKADTMAVFMSAQGSTLTYTVQQGTFVCHLPKQIALNTQIRSTRLGNDAPFVELVLFISAELSPSYFFLVN